MITSRTIAVGIVKAVGLLAIILLLLYFIYEIRTVLLYLSISLIFTLIAHPIVEFLKSKFRFNNIIAIVLTLILFVSAFVGVLLLFIPLVLSQSENLSLVNTQIIKENIRELTSLTANFLSHYNIESKFIFNQEKWLPKLDLEFFTNFFNSILDIMSNLSIGVASVFFITFFFLKDKQSFLNTARTILPDKHEDKIINSSFTIYNLLSRYFTGLLIQLLIIFILYLTVLLILGMENAIIIAFLSAILNIVPYLEPLISTIIATFLAMMNHIHGDFQTEILPSAIYIIVGFLIVQFIDNNISQPLIFSKSVKSHPLEIFLIIITGGFLFGILGMIIAVPLYTIIKVVCKEFLPDNKLVQLLTKNI